METKERKAACIATAMKQNSGIRKNHTESTVLLHVVTASTGYIQSKRNTALADVIFKMYQFFKYIETQVKK